MRMLATYRDSKGRKLNDAAQQLIAPGFVGHFRHLDLPLLPTGFPRVARHFGMSAIDIPGYTRDPRPNELQLTEPMWVLQRRGPFMYSGDLDGMRHAIVVNGWERDEGEGEWTCFVNPLVGRHQRMESERLREAIPHFGAPLLLF
jgi:hypothetical protein